MMSTPTPTDKAQCISSQYFKSGASKPPNDISNDAPDTGEVIVLAGNPNVGKSVVFNALTGLYTTVSNYPGTTVDIPKGQLPDERLVKDTPGVYGLSQFSEEEQVAQKTILEADKIINVTSAMSLERDLFLTQQLIDYGKPVVMVLNQMDEARSRNIGIHIEKLSTQLGITVIPAVAITGEGLDAIVPALANCKQGNKTPNTPDLTTLLELENNPAKQLLVYGERRHHVNAIISQVVSLTDHQKPSLSQHMGQLFLNPVVGVITAMVVLLALYQIVGVWVAGNLVNLTEKTIMLGYVVPFIQGMVMKVVPEHSPLFTILAGEFGVLTMSIQYIFGVLFPIIFGFYIYVSVLEDCGYLPRVAVLCDSLLHKIGLNGRAVIPIILGFGCVTMATVSTRVLTSQRERTIASTIIAITIPCSAQIAVLVGLMGQAGGFKAWLLFLGTLVTTLLVLGTILNKMLPGKSTPLILDLPPMRLPTVKNIAVKTWVRTVVFLKEAAPLFILGSLLVSVAQVTGVLAWIEHAVEPITMTLLHLPAKTADVFVMGMVRRDFGAAGLYFMADTLTSVQIITALLTITLFVPCIASATVIWKERGIVESTSVLIGSWVIAFGIGALACRLFEAVPFLS